MAKPPDLHLRAAYRFLTEHGRMAEAREIGNIPVLAFSASRKSRWDHKVRQYMACEALKQAGLFHEFASQFWPAGRTAAGDRRMEYYREKYQAHIAAGGRRFPRQSTRNRPAASQTQDVPVEEQYSESMMVRTKEELREARRREGTLVMAYRDYLREKGISVKAKKFRVCGDASLLRCDVFEEGRGNLIEAKGTVTREAIRMAIGELADYSRFLSLAPKKAVLTPTRPWADLESLLTSQGISCVWREARGRFVDNADGRFV